MTIQQLLSLTLGHPIHHLRNWWLTKIEDHYLICASTEAQKAREHQHNVAYYQKQAALVRSRRNTP